MRDQPRDDLFIDSNGCPTERVWLGDQQVTIHYDDLPEKDITTVHGLRVTTALRTVIDLAPDCEPGELERMVDDCLRRGLFTVDEAWRRISEPDMRSRLGARLLGRVLPTDAGGDQRPSGRER